MSEPTPEITYGLPITDERKNAPRPANWPEGETNLYAYLPDVDFVVEAVSPEHACERFAPIAKDVHLPAPRPEDFQKIDTFAL